MVRKITGKPSASPIQHLKVNNPFSMDEFTDAIPKLHDTGVGPDDVHYQMLKHLPNDALLTLLNILNNVWALGKFPVGNIYSYTSS